MFFRDFSTYFIAFFWFICSVDTGAISLTSKEQWQKNNKCGSSVNGVSTIEFAATLQFRNDHSARFSSKGKTPWMELHGKHVADSQLCIEHLKQTLNVDANTHLSDEQQAIARAFLKLTEENLYWTMCIEMFGEDLAPIKSVIPYRGFKLWMTVFFLRRMIAKETWGHGIGRHTNQEVWDIAVRDMNAISHFLGTKSFMMGDTPSEIDCAIFGMMAQIYWHMPGSRHQVYIKDNLQNVVDYIYRMKERYWPDWEAVTLEGSKYCSDHGKLYFPEKIRDENEDYVKDSKRLTSDDNILPGNDVDRVLNGNSGLVSRNDNSVPVRRNGNSGSMSRNDNS